jgi:quercetin dioxygenase-like cupin family protein
MRSWDLSKIDVEPQKPVVVDSEDEGRAILIALLAGEGLPEHQVHERAWVMVVSGRVRIGKPNGEDAEGGSGLLAIFDPAERHEVVAIEDARVLLVLSPWPGEGHPSRRD